MTELVLLGICMTSQDFIAKWHNVELKERTASQSHFNDLFALLEIDDPITADNKGEWFTFEKGASVRLEPIPRESRGEGGREGQSQSKET